jgi:aryl-alcohol dehydrogenase-like predicted oxidoreductase
MLRLCDSTNHIRVEHKTTRAPPARGARALIFRWCTRIAPSGVSMPCASSPIGKVSVAQIALAWLLTRPAVSSVIIGAKSAQQLHESIASIRVQLSAAELEALDEISQLPAEYPGWMLSLQGQYRSKPPVKD